MPTAFPERPKLLGAVMDPALLGKKRTPLEVKKVRRYQKRKKRRLVEANAPDWQRWDAAAEKAGLGFAEFARRALDRFSDLVEARERGEA